MAKIIYKEGCEGQNTLESIEGIEINLFNKQKALIYPKYSELPIFDGKQADEWRAEILKEDEDMCVLSCSRTDDYYIWTATPYSDSIDVCCGFPCMVIPTIIYD